MYVFVFDINKCVGCQACAVACSIENKTEPQFIWRNISTYNVSQHPDLPLFHLSLACNHCQDAPCKNNCPALAYSRDLGTGVILHHAHRCIGCKYCTWSCPYDAPKFNYITQVVEKCTFCNSRIKEGLLPACIQKCPTGALSLGTKEMDFENKTITGFTEQGLQPSIRFIDRRKPEHVPEFSSRHKVVDNLPEFVQSIEIQRDKINAFNEWTLVIFTLLASVLTGMFAASIRSNFVIDILWFVGAGLGAMILSALHLGKPLRAYRSIFNLRRSWLSREIFCFAAFIILSAVHLFYLPQIIWFSWLVIFIGFLSLVSIDMVYNVSIQILPFKLHSAHVFLTGFLAWGVFSQNPVLYVPMVLLKAGIYIYRKRELRMNWFNWLSAVRLDFLLSFPVIFWFFDWDRLYWYAALSVLLGEIVDRIEYYNQQKIMNPSRQIAGDMIRNKFVKKT